MPRATSPILFSKCHSQPERAADISRLLDPSYSSSSSGSSSSTHVHAYVDRHGELHDPDYRYFPVAAPAKRTTSPHRATAAAYNMAARPRWELVDEDALDLEEEEDLFSARLHNTNNNNNKRHTRDRDSFSSHRAYTPTYPSHPHSFDSDDTVLDEYEDDDFAPRDRFPALLRTTFSRDRKRRASSLLSDAPTPALTDASLVAPSPSPLAQHHSLPASPLSPHSSLFAHYPVRTMSRQQHEEEDKEAREKEEREREVEEELERRTEWTPTCTQALRREWQAVTLRIRFSVFRTQRRIKNRFL